MPDSSPGTGGVGSYQFSNSPVSGGSTFYYVVRAVKGSCESLNSAEASAPATGDCLLEPNFDGATSVTLLGGGQGCGLRVAWSAGASQCGGALTYSVYRSTNPLFVPSAADRIASCVTGTSFDDTANTGLPVDTTVRYVVRAEDGGASGGGACNGGNAETNSVRVAGVASTSPGSPTLYSHDFETGVGLSDWVAGTFNTGSSADWRGIRACTANSGSNVFRFGGNVCNTNYGDDVFAFAQPDGADGVAVPAGSTTVRLSFWHRWSFETGWDGAMLAVSLDGSTYTLVAAASILTNSYNGSTGNGAGNPAWTGDQAAFVQTTVNLDAACVAAGAVGGCAGQDVRIAFTGYSDVNTTDDGWYLDDVVVTRDATPGCVPSPPNPVQFLTATGKHEQVTAEWLAPAFGSYASTRLRTATGAPPADPTQGILLVDESGSPSEKEQFAHSTGAGSNGTVQHYSAFGNNGADVFSARRSVSGLPQATGGNWKWNFGTSASALAPPIQGRGLGVFVPSNDRAFYGLAIGANGGNWKSGYRPVAMNAPAQSSPIVMLAADTGLPHDATFVGSQDGYVYCFRADTGAGCSGWPAGGRSVSGFGMIQAQPMFDPVTKRILVGTRNTLAPNAFVAINVLNGVTGWTFTNIGSQGGDGLSMGIMSSPALILGAQVVFTSRARLGGSAHTVWALDFSAAGASLAWTRDLGDIDAAATHDFTLNRVIVGTNGGSVHALDPMASGATLWSRSFGNGAVKTFVYYHAAIGRLYFATNDTVWAIPASGATGSDWSRGGLFSPTRPLAHFGTTRSYVGACNDAACASGRVIELDSANGWATQKTLDLAGVGGLSPVTIDRSQSPALLHAGSRSGRAVAVELPLP